MVWEVVARTREGKRGGGITAGGGRVLQFIQDSWGGPPEKAPLE